MPGATLCPLDTVLLRRDSQLVVVDPEQNFISNLDAEGFTERCGDNDTTVFIYACPSFRFHVTLQSS